MAETSYDYYVILNFRTTKVFTLEEIVESAIVVVDAKTLLIVRTLHEYIKPTILRCLSAETNFRHDLSDAEVHFTDHLYQIRNVIYEFCDKKLLLVTIGQEHLTKMFPGQITIERACRRNAFSAHETFIFQRFQHWCNLKDVFKYVTDRDIPREAWEKNELCHLQRCLGLPYEDVYMSCVIEARTAVAIVKALAKQLSTGLFITTSIVQEATNCPPYFVRHEMPDDCEVLINLKMLLCK